MDTTPAEIQIDTTIAEFFQRVILAEHWNNRTNIPLMSIKYNMKLMCLERTRAHHVLQSLVIGFSKSYIYLGTWRLMLAR